MLKLSKDKIHNLEVFKMKSKLTSFLAGVLTVVLLAGASVTALAADAAS